MCGTVRMSAAAALLACLAATPGARAAGDENRLPGRLAKLRVMQGDYPRAYFFRASESPGKDPSLTYDTWEKSYERLMGIEGKALDEEIPALSRRNIDFFTRFKQRHPDQIVLLHFNGNARDPRYQTDVFFAGHWIYFNGAKVLADVPAEQGETDLRVEDATLFRTNVGRYRNKNEDIGLCAIGPDGKPNWHESEQVQLVSVSEKEGVIRVRRGCYGTTPRSFAAGKSYAAAHVYEGPWGADPESSSLMWFYNYSTAAPATPRVEARRTSFSRSSSNGSDPAASFPPSTAWSST